MNTVVVTNTVMGALVTGLILLAAVFYLYGIIRASFVSITGKGSMDDFLANLVTVMRCTSDKFGRRFRI